MIWYQRCEKNGIAVIINTRIIFFSISTSPKNSEDKTKAVSKTPDVTRSTSSLNSNISNPDLKISETKDLINAIDSKTKS